jgi:transmembrane sensor
MTGDPTDNDLLAQAVDWRMRIEAAPEDRALRSALESWLATSQAHRSAWRDVERMTRVAGALPADYADPQGPVLADRRPQPRRPGVRLRRAAFAALALAACLAFVFLPTLQLWLASDHRTATAELRTITLDDGSVVSLDAASAIAVRYGAARREVTLLSGRAFFEVVPASDRPFVVAVDDATVTVTGTAFDVRSSAQTTSVAVQSGTVEVALDHGRRPAAVLTRGQRLDIDRKSDRVAKSGISPDDVASWRNHRLVVDRATVAEVVEELGRHYPGVVLMRDRALGDRRVSGVFDLRHPVEALQAAVRTHDGSVARITPYVVVISGP